MEARRVRQLRVLGIDPCRKGIGFGVIDGSGRLIDWGVARLYSTNDEEFLVRLDALASRNRATLLVLQETAGTMRGAVAKRRALLATEYWRAREVASRVIQRRLLDAHFGLGHRASKHDLSLAVCDIYPELRVHLPPKRRPWDSESPRTRMFLAVALSVCAVAAPLKTADA